MTPILSFHPSIRVSGHVGGSRFEEKLVDVVGVYLNPTTAQDIITKVQRGRATLHQIKSTTEH